MAQKSATSHLGTATGSTSGRVKKRGRGYRLPSQLKYIIESVYAFFEKEKQEQRSLLRNQVVKRTAMACGIGTTTVSRLHKNFQGRKGLLPSSEKRYVESRVQIALDEYNVAAIRKEIHQFYEQKEFPTLDSLLGVHKAKELFKGGRTTLWKVVREMGFCYKKHENRRYIYEQPRIIQQWHDYLRRLRKNRSPTEDRPMVYLDETWVNAHHGRDTMWVDDDGEAGWKRPSDKGGRLIVLHAGTADSWIDGAERVF